MYSIFLRLVRLGIGLAESAEITEISGLSGGEWERLKALADAQGLSAVVLDGLNTDENLAKSMPLQLKLEWIGVVLQEENIVAAQEKAAKSMSELFAKNGIRTYVLKGTVIAECYPKPNHRRSSDMDCFLAFEPKSKSQVSGFRLQDSHEEAWKRGNELIRAEGYEVGEGFYKNSTFHLPGLMVENHMFLTPWRGNKKLKELERLLQRLIVESLEFRGSSRDKSLSRICEFEHGAYRPPVMVTALFMIEHVYSHFLHEGLTWRHVLDWVMFCKKHETEIDWNQLNAYIDEFGFRRFYDSYCRMGQLLLGELTEEVLTKAEKRMLADIWAPLDLHETLHGVKGKLALAGNTFRARWKYRYFTDMNWMQALWIQAKGFLFEKKPTL